MNMMMMMTMIISMVVLVMLHYVECAEYDGGDAGGNIDDVDVYTCVGGYIYIGLRCG